MPNLKLELGPGQEVTANTDAITVRQIKELAEAVAEINRKHSILNVNPQKDGETFDEYKKRVSAERMKKDGESMSDYLARIHPVNLDSQLQIFDALRAVAKVLNKKDLDEDAFENAPYVAAKNFVREVLVACDLVE